MTYETAGFAHELELFVAVADAEHITRAAELLQVPQPTVSRTMARLSASLGVDLLVRDGRAVRLTNEGRALAEHARRALAELRLGIDTVRDDVDPEVGRVSLGFLHSMGPVAVPTMLTGFRRAHPKIRVMLLQDAAGRIVDEVESGRIDLGLAAPIPTSAAIESHPLATQRIVALLPDDHRLVGRQTLRIRDIADEPFITMRQGYGMRTITDRLLGGAGIQTEYAFESEEMSTAAGLVAAGLGVAVLAAGTAVPGTVEIPLADKGAVRVINLIWSSRRTLAPPALALRAHIIESGPLALGRGML